MNKNSQSTYAEPITVSADRANDMDLLWDEEGFALSGGSLKSLTLSIDGTQEATPTWQQKQDNALAEYQDSHVQEQISDATHSIYKLFGSYIAATLFGAQKKDRLNVLDVGCGIGRRWPMYMRKLIGKVNYFGMDAIDLNLDREYPFICARLEKLGEVQAFHNRFDTFVFGTSLDHFEDIDEVANAVQKLAAPGATVVFWIGLHDASFVASEEGANAMHKTFEDTGPFAVMSRFIHFVLWKFPRLFYVLGQRRNKLKRGESLDDLHFWYFTEKDLPGLLARFGEVSDISMVPGSNSVFAACHVKSKTSA